MNIKTKAWISAFRLRTLPLAASSIILGSFLAAADNAFNATVLILALITTLFLQILSNLANDFGDSSNGIDNDTRVGPQRAVQSGVITLNEMRNMIIVFTILSFISGIALLYIALSGLKFNYAIIFLALGILAIAAAIKYTVGSNPYGYRGLGDLFVFLFFGLTGVLGTYFLHTHHLPINLVLPATSVGLFSVGVLNMNNMRDRESDANSGKRTLVVLLGFRNARIYHLLLIIGALGTSLAYTISNFNSYWQLIYFVIFPILFANMRKVWYNSTPAELDPELKKLALSTLLFSITFGLGLLVQ